MYGYIYKTTDLTNGKIYIGQHKSSKFDTKYYGSGVILKRLMSTIGKDNFKCELIESCNSAEELNSREIFWISELNSLDRNIGYNIATGGSFGDSGYHSGMLGKSQSEYQKECARKSSSGENNPFNRVPGLRELKSKQMIGNTNASGGAGMKFINRGYSEQKRVLECEIPLYESMGWKRGKCQKVKDDTHKAYSIKYANGSYITDGENTKFVSNSDIDKFLNCGWTVGKAKRKHI